MNFESFAHAGRSGRRRQLAPVPRVAETFEARQLLTAPQILSPTANATLTTQPHTIAWTPVANAVSYDLWVSDMDTQTVIFVQNGITDTSYTPPELLNQGRVRAWVRATLADLSQTAWSSPVDFLVQVTPTITGPYNYDQPVGSRYKLDTPTPALEWTGAPGSGSFDIFLTNVTTNTSKQWNVPGTIKTSTIVVDQAPTSGLFRLQLTTTTSGGSVSTVSTEYLPADASAEQIQAALQKLSGFSNTRVVSGLTPGNDQQFTIEFRNFENADSTFTVELENSTVAGLYTVTNGLTAQNRWFQFPTADVGPLQQFKVYIRSIDDGGRVGNWSSAFGAPGRNISFETAPKVTGLSPAQQSPANLQIFPEEDTTPLLTWNAVPNATQYDLWFSRKYNNGTQSILYRRTALTTNSFQIPADLADGNYIFWVRAIRTVPNRPDATVIGNWSSAAEFFIGQKTYVPQVSTLAVEGAPTSGTFRLSVLTSAAGTAWQQTTALPYNATAAQVQAALRQLKAFSAVTVSTTGGVPGWLHTITFNGINAPVALNVVDSTTTATFKVQITRPVSAVMNGRTTITGPVGQDVGGVNTVTDERPTVTWQAVDKAVRYEVWVDRKGAASPYMLDNSPVNSYTFPNTLPAGDYTVWVRAFSSTGTTCKWSLPFQFTATGGKPLILSPADNSPVGANPTITWTPIASAASYEIWIAWVGVDFDYYVQGDIPLAEHTVTAALPAGTYRVWVRAILADNTALAWSDPITLTVAETERGRPDADAQLYQLTALTPALRQRRLQAETGPSPADTADPTAETAPSATATITVAEHPMAEADAAEVPAPLPVQSSAQPESLLPVDAVQLPEAAISSLAEDCQAAEWWMVPGEPAAATP